MWNKVGVAEGEGGDFRIWDGESFSHPVFWTMLQAKPDFSQTFNVELKDRFPRPSNEHQN